MRRTLVILMALAAAGRLAAFELVGPGGRTATVCLAPGAEPSSRLAAEELTNSVAKITGRLLPVVETSDPAGLAPAVLVGTLVRFPGKVPEDVRAKLGGMRQFEAAYTGVRGDALLFVGREEAAELYAVYHFLERELGVRWFQAPLPEDPGDYVPRAAVLSVAPFERYREPFFSERRLDLTGAAAMPTPVLGMSTAVRNGFQTPPPYGGRTRFENPGDFYARRTPRRRQHLGGGEGTFKALIPQKEFKEHPELFSMVNGERSAGDRLCHYCLSNPEVRKRVSDDWLKKLDAAGGLGDYHFAQCDTPRGVCTCEACMALDGPGELKDKSLYRSTTTRFVKTVNAICEPVFAKHPGAEAVYWAYLNYRELPEGVRPDPRLKLWLCVHGRCYGHFLDDPACATNRRFHKLLLGWLKLLPQAFVYDYTTCSHQFYSCDECVEAHDIRLYRDLGMIGWKNEASFSDARPVGKSSASAYRDKFPSNWQWLYLTGHLLWDPDLDAKAFVEEAERLYYGAAYPAMAKYHALRRKLWKESPVHFGYPYGDNRRPTLLNRPDTAEELLRLLDEAEGLAADDAVRLFRVRRDRRWLTEYWIKPNTELKAVAAKAFKVPEARTGIVLDGRGEDVAWTGAYYTDDFQTMAAGKAGGKTPREQATSVGVLYDDSALYFLFQAREPRMDLLKARDTPGVAVWEDDCFEVFLVPPGADHSCYHLAVNPRGNLWGTVSTGGLDRNCFGAEAKGRLDADGYTVELRLPTANVSPIRVGDTWRVLIGRSRVGKRPGGAGHETCTLSGIAYTDELHYLPMVFGEPYLANGNAETLDARGVPKYWICPKGCEVVKGTSTGNQVRLRHLQYALREMAHGALQQANRPRRLRYSLRARGKGRFCIFFVRYRDTPDATARYGYTRRQLQPSGAGADVELTPEMTVYGGEYEVPAGEWGGIACIAHGEEAIVDDIVVEPLEQ